jgi:hypothetical protein
MNDSSTLAPARSVPGRFNFRYRAVAAGVHLLVSALVACFAAIAVLGLWYPGQFRALAGGRDLFLLLTLVDVVLGPVLTFAVFNPAKGMSQLRRDLAAIAVIQLAALAYGLHTVFIARPVAMVFEVDRLRLVTAHDVAADELPKAKRPYRTLPLTGPLLLGARTPQAGAEHNDALFEGLAGNDISSRPIFWQPYERSRAQALARSRPLSMLLDHYPTRAAELRDRLAELHSDPSTGRFLPAMARGDWVAVLDRAGEVLGYLPVDGFF